MVKNPPGYYAANQRAGIAIPYDGLQAVKAAAQKYGAHYLILEHDHPRALDPLYQQPDHYEGFRYLFTVEDTICFSILVEEMNE